MATVWSRNASADGVVCVGGGVGVAAAEQAAAMITSTPTIAATQADLRMMTCPGTYLRIALLLVFAVSVGFRELQERLKQ